jgi:DNA (cytosine-5)-methyltransferase 1
VKGFYTKDLAGVPVIDSMVHTKWNQEMQTKPEREYTSIELFAGGGGLALGMEMAGFHHIMLNEFDHSACETLRVNRPNWNVIEGDVHNLDFTQYGGKVDFISGGFPCTAFSYAGERRGFEDARGTLFFELARAVKEIQPKVFMCENVKGLVTHDNGRTFQVIKDVIKDIGYTLVEPEVLKAILYQVPQKRERLILVAIRNDLSGMVNFRYPEPYERVLTLRDALYKGILYDCDVPASEGQKYPQRKKEIMEMVPEGGNWRDLPENIQREYLKGSVSLDGGKTGIARRLSMDEPSLTLTCSPAMKQTERCHPYETRPLTVREYARIQTFPDDWKFMGKLDAQYKQIGNAVPVNLAYAIGRSLIRLFNDINKIENK